MLGRNHFICASSILFTMTTTHIVFDRVRTGIIDNFWGLNPKYLSFFQTIDSKIWSFLGFTDDFSSSLPLLFLLSFVCALFGTLCTDCDSKSSIIGRYVYVPVGHRTWTHAIYVPLFCFIVGQSIVPIAWFGLGWLIHEIMDAFSYEGNAFLYPFVGYNKFGQAKVKKGIHICKFYRCGKTSEKIFVSIVIAICILVCLLFLAAPHFYIDIIGEGYGILS